MPSDQLTFHRDVYLPPFIRDRLPTGRRPLQYTRHASTEAAADHVTELPDTLTPEPEIVVEVTVGADLRPTKLLVRVPLDLVCDLCLVVVPDGEVFRAITLWVNRRTDCHRTLDTSRYAPSPN